MLKNLNAGIIRRLAANSLNVIETGSLHAYILHRSFAHHRNLRNT